MEAGSLILKLTIDPIRMKERSRIGLSVFLVILSWPLRISAGTVLPYGVYQYRKSHSYSSLCLSSSQCLGSSSSVVCYQKRNQSFPFYSCMWRFAFINNLNLKPWTPIFIKQFESLPCHLEIHNVNHESTSLSPSPSLHRFSPPDPMIWSIPQIRGNFPITPPSSQYDRNIGYDPSP